MTNQVRGIAQTRAALTEAVVKVEAAAPTAENAGAQIVAGKMRDRAPVDTGRLRASIHAEGSAAVADTPYAIYVEPFAAAAAEAAEGEIETAMVAVFRTALGGR